MLNPGNFGLVIAVVAGVGVARAGVAAVGIWPDADVTPDTNFLSAGRSNNDLLPSPANQADSAPLKLPVCSFHLS